MLSVRNNKKFRTTVSRSSLEEDEEYRNVATICAEALFSHITVEVQRISAQTGNPLSQASTAGRWLYRSLLDTATQPVYQSLAKLYQELPHVVVEHVRLDDENVSGRDLLSLNDIAAMPQFWTVESRAVDLLGTISRDLGRELNVMEFLSTLAPEQDDPEVDSIVVDAHYFAPELLKSHTITEAKFSSAHQRTLLRWQPRPEDSPSLLLGERHFEAIAERLVRHGAETTRQAHRYRTGVSEEDLPNLWRFSWGSRHEQRLDLKAWPVARVEGDAPEVNGVITRIVTVLSNDKELGKTYQLISKGLSDPSLMGTVDEITLLLARAIINAACSLAATQVDSEPSRYGRPLSARYDHNETRRTRRGLASTWRDLHSDVASVLQKVGLPHTLDGQLEDLVGDYSNWFDASNYWRDWEEAEEEPF